LPVHDSQLKRTAKGTLKDPRALPYLRDLLGIALNRSTPNDLVVFTNDDVVLSPGLTETLCLVENAAWSSRMEFVRLPELPTCLEIMMGRKHPGADLFAFTPEWWVLHGDDMPDMVLGAPEWDMVLRLLMQITTGVELHAAIAHEEHRSYWLTHTSDRSTVHNRKLAFEWLAERKLTWD
jgi:hypothetical protein